MVVRESVKVCKFGSEVKERKNGEDEGGGQG